MSDTMTSREHEALATIALLAAQADGRREPAEIERMSAVFATFGGAGAAGVHARVALGNAALEGEAAALTTPALREAAWELALGVCSAGGEPNAAEKTFLARLRAALGLPAEPGAASPVTALAAVTGPPPAPSAPPAPAAPAGNDAAIDAKIEQAAILAGALELLPQNLATLGVVPVQVKLVADVGALSGHAVDAGHAKELLATVGLGLSGQAIEGFARRFLGGLAGRLAGRGIGALVGAATSAAATFAATWAIGQVARSWYASGRTLDRADLEATFQRELEQGRAKFGQLEDAVTERARSIRLPDLAGLGRG